MYTMQHISFKYQSQSTDAAWTEILRISEIGYDIDTLKSTRSWYDDSRTLKTFGIWSSEESYG